MVWVAGVVEDCPAGGGSPLLKQDGCPVATSDAQREEGQRGGRDLTHEVVGVSCRHGLRVKG